MLGESVQLSTPILFLKYDANVHFKVISEDDIVLGLNINDEMIKLISNQIKYEDELKEKMYDVDKTVITSKCVGYIDIGILMSVQLADENFFPDIDNNSSIPAASLIRSPDNEYFIAINRILYEYKLSNDHFKQTVAKAIFAHELGHYLAKHNECDHKLIFDNYDKYNDPNKPLFDVIAICLLHGGVFTIEQEADMFALQMCDKAGLIASISLVASKSDTLGIRFELMNRINHYLWLDDVEQTIELDIYIFNDNELEELFSGQQS